MIYLEKLIVTLGYFSFAESLSMLLLQYGSNFYIGGLVLYCPHSIMYFLFMVL